MIPYFGDFAEDATVYIPINTFSSNDPTASVTVTDLLNTDVHIHKDGGTTQRNNAAGITMTVDYDSITGNHLLAIDTSDDTVAGFWVAGHEYQVRIEGATVDAGTVNAWVGAFSIERSGGALALIKNGTYGLSALNAILAHADYGLAKLVRSTTPANTLTVDANHLVAVPVTQKVDIETIKTQAITCAAGVTVLASVGTAATSTAQTGDSFARIGAPAGASISADIAAIPDATEIEAAVDAALDNAIPALPTAGSINHKILWLMRALVEKISITEASGDAEMFEVASSLGTVSSAFSSAAGITLRKRMVI
jgi:hypothetical protein